jgi:hypothetical protein
VGWSPAGALAPVSFLATQARHLQRLAGNAAVATMLQRSDLPVQRNSKQNIVRAGFTDAEAESLKAVIGGWGSAADLVTKGLQPSYLRTVMADHTVQMVRKKALENLSEHYYGIAKHLCVVAGAANLGALILKGLNNKTVDIMTGYPVPVFRATIISMASVGEIKDVSGLGKIFERYPRFDGIVSAQLQGAAASLNTVIKWLAGLSATSLRYLQLNGPAFDVLELLAQHEFSDAQLVRLGHFSTENPPGNNEYEGIGAKDKSYRVGHFARFHTIRGMSSANALPGEKTIWPVKTTVAEVRGICLEFDGATGFSTQQRYWYTPALIPVRVVVDGNGSGLFEPTHFDQMYPQSGGVVTVEFYNQLKAITAKKADWTEPA